MRGRPLTLSPAAATRPHSHSPLRQVARREAGREGGGQRGSQRGARRRRGVAGGRHCLRLLKRGNEPLGKEEWRRGVEQANLLSSSLFILSARPAVPTHARSCSSNANSENESPLRGNTTPASLSPSTQHNTHTHTHTPLSILTLSPSTTPRPPAPPRATRTAPRTPPQPPGGRAGRQVNPPWAETPPQTETRTRPRRP